MYSVLGTSRQLNVAPEAALSLLLGQAVSDIRHEHPDPHSDEGDAVGVAVATIITLQARPNGTISRLFPANFLIGWAYILSFGILPLGIHRCSTQSVTPDWVCFGGSGRDYGVRALPHAAQPCSYHITQRTVHPNAGSRAPGTCSPSRDDC